MDDKWQSGRWVFYVTCHSNTLAREPCWRTQEPYVGPRILGHGGTSAQASSGRGALPMGLSRAGPHGHPERPVLKAPPSLCCGPHHSLLCARAKGLVSAHYLSGRGRSSRRQQPLPC